MCYGSIMTPEQLQALRTEYESGVIPHSILCKKYGISYHKLTNMVNTKGWVKRKPPSEKKILESVFLFDLDADKNAVMTAANVVATHRRDVAQLRTISGILVERLGLELAGKLPMGAENTPIICRGSRESPADLLEKLSRVMVRTTEIEPAGIWP